MTDVVTGLENARRSLLEQGLRNPLINYRPSRARGLEIVDERSADVYQILVTNGKSMDFYSDPSKDQEQEPIQPVLRPIPPAWYNPAIRDVRVWVIWRNSYPDATDDEISLDQPDSITFGDDESRFQDNHLQTAYSSKELQKRLLTTSDIARTNIEEQGVNILYLALGELLWFEADSSQVAHRAPLVLLPVELSRKDAQARFTLRYTESGVGGNLSLKEKLYSEFRLQIPLLFENEEVEEGDLDIVKYFESVRQIISGQKRWEVKSDSINIGFYSFGKFLMFNDLDANGWPSEKQPIGHPILAALLGPSGFATGLRENFDTVSQEDIDAYLSPNQHSHIMDADSSQAKAILAVKRGATMIIQGPPGTGKSQTIANIISEVVAQNKTILFVAEKLAALDVVKRRLDKVGVGDLCLELHSHKANKKSVVAELKRTANLGKPEISEYNDELAEHSILKTRLNSYSAAVNTPIRNSGITPIKAYGLFLKFAKKLDGVSVSGWSDIAAADWTEGEYRQRLELVKELEYRLQQTGPLTKHPYRGSRLRVSMPLLQQDTAALAEKTLSPLTELQQAISSVDERFGIGQSRLSFKNAGVIDSVLKTTRIYRALASKGKTSGDWISPVLKFLTTLLLAGEKFIKEWSKISEVVQPSSLTADVASMQTKIRKNTGIVGRLFGGRASAQREFESLCRTPFAGDPSAQLALLDDIEAAKKLHSDLLEHQKSAQALLGPMWNGKDSDWSEIQIMVDALHHVQSAIQDGTTTTQLYEKLNSGALAPAGMEKLQQILDDALTQTKQLVHHLELDVEKRFGTADIENTRIDDLISAVEAWKNDTTKLQDLIRVNQTILNLRELKLNSLAELANQWDISNTKLVDVFERNRYDSLIRVALQERQPLGEFDGERQTKWVHRFRQVDRLMLIENRQRLVLDHFGRLGRTKIGQAGILRSEFERKRGLKPIRRLLSEAPGAIQELKPIFMMSPMSVATYLEPGKIDFDVVIFDEASQIRPADSFGAILRGKQVIVVGDNKQLPPTSFFDSISEIEDENEDDESVRVSDYESILGLFNRAGARDQMLRWHYRSQHESLIAVSNHEFYENKLLIPPSALRESADLGLKFHHLPETVYEPGTRRTNRGEARVVAHAVIQHASRHSELTLGVAAFSQAQMEAIRDELEVLRRENPELEGFFSPQRPEPFFIKNLENVQGDERDVILISIGYGKTQDGRLSHNFGPLNRDGGERRLNVLITRSRLRCEVFANFRADDIDLARSESFGVAALRRYLKFAETGDLELPLNSGREPGSAFEEVVAERLQVMGYEVQYQVGTAGFFIDLAIVDKDAPGTFLLGIECDGASYHSSSSARDRDRLRQTILESKGWLIHRIWSTDWFRNPERELQRISTAIEEAQQKKGSRLRSQDASVLPQEPVAVARSVQPTETQQLHEVKYATEYRLATPRQYNYGDVSITEVPSSIIRELIEKVIEVEAPIHVDELIRRVSRALGYERAKSKIRETILYCIRSVPFVDKVEDFVYSAHAVDIPIRDRSSLPTESRNINFIASEEILSCAEKIIRASHGGVTRDEIIREIGATFGFKRITKEIESAISQTLDSSVGGYKITMRNNIYYSD